jgi:hypothetical protein
MSNWNISFIVRQHARLDGLYRVSRDQDGFILDLDPVKPSIFEGRSGVIVFLVSAAGLAGWLLFGG